MDQLDYFVLQARSEGQTDDQIRQQLLSAGWPVAQINAALSPAPMPKAKSRIRNSKIVIAIAVVSLVAVLAGVIVFALSKSTSSPKISYTTVASEFISDVQTKNQTAADSLESQALKSQGGSSAHTASFEQYCINYGKGCTLFFSSNFINQATVSYGSYKALNGTLGKSVTLTLPGNKFPGSSCTTSAYNIVLTLNLVPYHNTWLIDSISPGGVNDTISCS